MSAIAIITAAPSALAKKINALLTDGCAKEISCLSIDAEGKAITAVVSDNPAMSVNSSGTIVSVEVISGARSAVESALSRDVGASQYHRLLGVLSHTPQPQGEADPNPPSSAEPPPAAKKAANKAAKKAAKEHPKKPAAIYFALVATLQP